MRKTKDDSEITRQKILDSAINVFSRCGYSGARLEDIASEAGVTRGAVYHHFGGKSEVYLALINERFQNANSQIGEIAKKDATPKEKLRNLMVGMLVLLEESQEYRLVQELVLFKTAFIPELEEAIKHKKSNTANTVGFIENIISDGIKCGEFRDNTDAHAAAIAALGLFSGITSLWLFDTEAFSVKEYAERMIDIFIQGISA